MRSVPAWLLVLLVLGATHRLARLVTADYIMAWLRSWTERRDERAGRSADEPGKLAYLVTCDWCVSMYVAPVISVVAVWWGDNRVVLAALLALTASAFAGNMARLENL